MNIIVTSGGTSEPIDKVRKITNMSKGTLGEELARVASKHPLVDKVFFVSSKPVASENGKIIWVRPEGYEVYGQTQYDSTQAVHDTLHRVLTTKKIDIVIHAMAISDYTVDHLFSLEDMVDSFLEYADDHLDQERLDKQDLIKWFKQGRFRLDNSSKVSSKSNDLYIKLSPTEKIISKLKQWSPNTQVVGFKLLENVSTEQLLEVGRGIMKKNGCEFVFANDIKKIREEGGHQGFLILPNGGELELKGLEEVAGGIIEHSVNYRKEQ
jgi:phosphopantothenate--cysteine ligase